MKQYRRELRNNSTPAEKALWKLIKGKQIEGLRFRRQFSIGNYILDFYCPSLHLAIELDGEYHNDEHIFEKDQNRVKELFHQFHIQTLRFENRIVFQQPEAIINSILLFRNNLMGTQDNQASRGNTLPPSPSNLEGEPRTHIKTIIFDFGGVIVTLDHPKAVEKFGLLGLDDAPQRLNPYTQGGIFGQLELGRISADEFVDELSLLCHRQLSFDQCLDAWLGYRKELPERNLNALMRLRQEGYRLVLLSNTNPFMMHWASSTDFDGQGHPVEHYFDSVYLSYQMGVMKPDPRFFQMVLDKEQILPRETLFLDDGPRNVEAASRLGIRTMCPENGMDWTHDLFKMLGLDA